MTSKSRPITRLLSISIALLIACLATFVPAQQVAAQSRKPNIVFIFADDLGWQDTGFAGGKFCETPHLDRLASQGMIFRQAYAPAGNCAPSRACLVTGQYTPRHHVYAVGSTDRGPQRLKRMAPVPNKLTLPLETTTFAEALKAAGYATGMFGKCHLRSSNSGKSEHAGFDVVKVSQHGLNSDDPDDPKGIFSITTAACDFIEANQDRPFFAYIPHYAVHSKLQARSATLQRFRKKRDNGKASEALYAACTAELDTGIGLVLQKLDELKLSEQTLVVFTSDNGGTHTSQEPLRGKKGCYYEGGIRVPMAVRWPGMVKPGTKTDEPVINVDLYPTFLAAAGAASAKQPLDGASLLPLLKGDESFEREAIFWHFPGYLDGPVPRGRDPVFRTRPVSVVRKGDWKLHFYHEEWQLDGGRQNLDTNNAVELYNLAQDPGERHNLALENRQQRDALLDDLLAWHKSTGALLPTPANAKYNPGE